VTWLTFTPERQASAVTERARQEFGEVRTGFSGALPDRDPGFGISIAFNTATSEWGCPR
jgi:hypothetical protein